MLELMRKLLQCECVRHIYQADITRSKSFPAPVRVGLEIMDKLREHTSGLAVPHFVIDAPGGGENLCFRNMSSAEMAMMLFCAISSMIFILIPMCTKIFCAGTEPKVLRKRTKPAQKFLSVN